MPGRQKHRQGGSCIDNNAVGGPELIYTEQCDIGVSVAVVHLKRLQVVRNIGVQRLLFVVFPMKHVTNQLSCIS